MSYPFVYLLRYTVTLVDCSKLALELADMPTNFKVEFFKM